MIVKVLATALLAATLPAGFKPLNVQFKGHWQVVTGMRDGRHDGMSARSFHPGDAVNMQIEGTGLRIYGVTGPTGGQANVILQGQPDRTIDFYSPQKRTHVLLYASPPLDAGFHYAALVILRQRNASSRGTYVNIDQVALAGDAG